MVAERRFQVPDIRIVRATAEPAASSAGFEMVPPKLPVPRSPAAAKPVARARPAPRPAREAGAGPESRRGQADAGAARRSGAATARATDAGTCPASAATAARASSRAQPRAPIVLAQATPRRTCRCACLRAGERA